MKAQKRLKKGRLACAVRAEQSDAPAGERSGEVLQNLPAAKINVQTFEFNKRGHALLYVPRRPKVQNDLRSSSHSVRPMVTSVNTPVVQSAHELLIAEY